MKNFTQTGDLPIVAIIGRPNVGKSTLFNRILGWRRAVVEDLPGVTRDRNYALVTTQEIPFYIVDTGGFDLSLEDETNQAVISQTKIAVSEADAIIAVFDVKDGIHPLDIEVVNYLRKVSKPVFYAVNKCDSIAKDLYSAEFYQLGVSEIFEVSAINGRGVEDVIDAALKSFSKYESLRQAVKLEEDRERAREEQAELVAGREFEAISQEEEERLMDLLRNGAREEEEIFEASASNFAPVFIPGSEDLDTKEYLKQNRLRDLPLKSAGESVDEENLEDAVSEDSITIPRISLSIIGRPNAGKSTLLNTLIGKERAITSNISGTTRDNIDVEFERAGQKFLLVDTAGLRKKGKVEEGVERYSVLRTLRAIARSDVAVLMIDAVEGVTDQDAKIAGVAHELGKGLIIAINKWDLIDKKDQVIDDYEARVREALKFAQYASVVFVSAASGKRCTKILDIAEQIAAQRLRKVSTNRLNRLLRKVSQRQSMPDYRGNPVRLYYGTQIAVAPPRFMLFFNYPKAVHFSFLRFIKNSIRDEFGFNGTDVKIISRGK